MLKPNSNVMGWGVELWKVIRSLGDTFMNGIWAFVKETDPRELPQPFYPVWTQREVALTRHQIYQSLHLKPPSIQNNEKWVSVISKPLVYSVLL